VRHRIGQQTRNPEASSLYVGGGMAYTCSLLSKLLKLRRGFAAKVVIVSKGSLFLNIRETNLESEQQRKLEEHGSNYKRFWQ
jgi:hypothetical protein